MKTTTTTVIQHTVCVYISSVVTYCNLWYAKLGCKTTLSSIHQGPVSGTTMQRDQHALRLRRRANSSIVCPAICQKILLATAPLMSSTCAPVARLRAPAICKMKTVSESDPASNLRVVVNDTAPLNLCKPPVSVMFDPCRQLLPVGLCFRCTCSPLHACQEGRRLPGGAGPPNGVSRSGDRPLALTVSPTRPPDHRSPTALLMGSSLTALLSSSPTVPLLWIALLVSTGRVLHFHNLAALLSQRRTPRVARHAS